VGKRVQHTPPTGTTLTEFRRFLNTDFGTLRMNAKSTHTFAPLTQKARKPLIQQVNFGNGHGMPLPQHSSPGSRLRGGPWRHQKSKHKASTETITLRCCTVPDKHTRPTPLDAHAVLPELGQASGTGGPLGDSRSVQRSFTFVSDVCTSARYAVTPALDALLSWRGSCCWPIGSPASASVGGYHIVTPRGARVDLPRAADTLLRILHHLLPLAHPTCGARDSE
jgi:hypothetical protein